MRLSDLAPPLPRPRSLTPVNSRCVCGASTGGTGRICPDCPIEPGQVVVRDATGRTPERESGR
jgi:hypothetical protein